jgi:DNA-binding CsgD family transcriptional regulator
MAISVERDITERLRNAETLKKACGDLALEKKRLEEKNIAFREAMSALESEKNKMKDEIIVNVNKLILPILKRVKVKSGVSRKPLDLLEKSLEALTSSFGRHLTEKNLKLTPKEIEISNMVRGGLTTKEIAGLLNASSQTIDKHRNNIRRKLGLANKGVNLVTYLQNL